MTPESRRPTRPDMRPSEAGSRTPIRFGAAVENVFRSDLNGYLPLFSEVSSEFLLYGYHREARENQYFFILVQGARLSGNLVVEVAIARRPEFPYYRLSDEPQLGVGGFRERVAVLMTGNDYSGAAENPARCPGLPVCARSSRPERCRRTGAVSRAADLGAALPRVARSGEGGRAWRRPALSGPGQ